MPPLTQVPQSAHCYQCYVTAPETVIWVSCYKRHREYPNVVFPPEGMPISDVQSQHNSQAIAVLEREVHGSKLSSPVKDSRTHTKGRLLKSSTWCIVL